MREFGNLTDAANVVEIYSGFAQTCYSLLTMCPDIKDFAIVDLDPILNLSRRLLQKVSLYLLDSVRFISSNDMGGQESLRPDFAINIYSFQEMPPSVIDGYMQSIILKTANFF